MPAPISTLGLKKHYFPRKYAVLADPRAPVNAAHRKTNSAGAAPVASGSLQLLSVVVVSSAFSAKSSLQSPCFAVHAVGELAAANPALQTLGYDDGCHLAEMLRRHPDARLRSLDIWIDLFHLYGHVRAKCFLQHNPLTRLSQHDRVSVTVQTEACRRRLLHHVDDCGRVQQPRALQARFGWLWQGGRGRSMRLFAV